MESPLLGWWVQLVECSAFDESVRTAVLTEWGKGLSGTTICQIIWLADQPQPVRLMMYGASEDIPPDFEEMAAVVRPLMDDYQYFAFVFMKDTVLAAGGLETVVITKYSILRVNGRLMITSAIKAAVDADETLLAAFDEGKYGKEEG